MRTTTRTLAILTGMVLLSAACGGGSDVARQRLGAPAAQQDVAPGGSGASDGTGAEAAPEPGGPDSTEVTAVASPSDGWTAASDSGSGGAATGPGGRSLSGGARR